MSRSPRAVFFDMGGTLVFDRGFGQALARRLSSLVDVELGITVEPSQVLSVWERVGSQWGNLELWDLVRVMLLLRELGVVPRPELAERIYNGVIESYVEGFRLEEGVHSVFSELKGMGLLVGVITNVGSYDVVYRRLREEGLLEYVDVLVASQAVAWKKPSEEIFRVACRLAGFEPPGCVHVGDDPIADVLGAKRVGMRAIQVLRDAKHRSDLADAYVESVLEVPQVIESWLSSP
ncbi:HAD family hydrolase [Infirmifilum lucidum]|uniref:HAD family hydrolase n=1 Tax=Infirmifilum lucidum TaxID=2776706 RepID=A0A7L9FG47_9CREN|nr:HAD family hydrolase [Infirmifilum lucidum]QOJ78591.1 HAD family hydrolase [Infirmifilum lucidum]